jgi:hypothetical protein
MKKIICLVSLIMPVFSCIAVFAQSIINPNFIPKAAVQISKEGFVHPGILLSAGDLNHIQKMVRGGFEPWATAFNQFRAAPKAQKTYIILNRKPDGEGKFPVMSEGYGQYDARRDADAAFAQTIMWYITGDNGYAKKVLEILRLWYGSIKYPSSDILTAGMAMQKFCFAAEVMRYTPGSGWTDTDTEGFNGFLRIMLPSNDKPTAFMNQGSIGTMGYMSSGVFLNDKQIYGNAIARTTVGRESEVPNRDYSIKNQIREVIDSVTGEKKIVLVEMGRDQGHAQGDIGALGALARTAYVQGTKVNPQGDIVTDNTGVNVFQFLNNRLLTGAGIVAGYNFGYNQLFYPTIPVGTMAKPSYYLKVSSDTRGELASVYELIYNHYKYDERVNDNNPYLKSIKQVIDFYAPEPASEDFPGDGKLLFTREALKISPKGPPQKLKTVDYNELAKNYGRIQAASFLGSKGNINTDLKHQNFGNGDVGYRPIMDAEGTRRIVSEIKEKFYIWYKDIDVGKLPVDKMVLRAASSIGCKMDVILLNDATVKDFNKVTEDDLAKGEKLATIQVPATGWWTYFTTFTAQINQKISGKHSFALRFYDSHQVYTLQATVDWFKFVNTFGNEDNNAINASGFLNGAKVVNNSYVSLTNGSGITFKDMDFDSGIALLSATLSSVAPGKIEIHRNSIHGELLASYCIPNTKGLFAHVQRTNDIAGRQQGKAAICVVYKGNGTLKFQRYRNLTTMLQFEPVTSKNITIVTKGKAVLGKQYASITATSDGSAVDFNHINFMNTPKRIAFKIRTNKPAILLFNNINKTDTYTDEPFLKVPLPDTHNKWKIIYADMSTATKQIKGAQMVIMTVKGDGGLVDFAAMQFDPIVITKIN